MKNIRESICLLIIAIAPWVLAAQNEHKTLKIGSEDMTWGYQGAGKDITLEIPIDLSSEVSVVAATLHISENEMREIPNTITIKLMDVDTDINWRPGSWDWHEDNGFLQSSPSLQELLQEVVTNKSNWVRGGKIRFLFSGFQSKPITRATLSPDAKGFIEITYEDLNQDEIVEEQIEVRLDPSEPDESGLLIYPNPTYGNLNAEFKNVEEVTAWRIYDFTGREIISQNLTKARKNTGINASTLKPGLYIIRLVDGDGEVHFKKFMKQ